MKIEFVILLALGAFGAVKGAPAAAAAAANEKIPWCGPKVRTQQFQVLKLVCFTLNFTKQMAFQTEMGHSYIFEHTF